MKDKRTFDWGPPPEKGDSLKDVLMYFFIGVVFFGGIYMLLDTGKKPDYVATENESEEVSVKKAPNNVSSYKADNKTLVQQQNFVKQPQPPEVTKPPVEITYKASGVEAQFQSKPQFYVQMGAFADKESAKEIYKVLKQTGSDPILKVPDRKNSVYRVLIGPFNSEADADYKAEKLNELDLPCFVVEQ